MEKKTASATAYLLTFPRPPLRFIASTALKKARSAQYTDMNISF